MCHSWMKCLKRGYAFLCSFPHSQYAWAWEPKERRGHFQFYTRIFDRENLFPFQILRSKDLEVLVLIGDIFYQRTQTWFCDVRSWECHGPSGFFTQLTQQADERVSVLANWQGDMDAVIWSIDAKNTRSGPRGLAGHLLTPPGPILPVNEKLRQYNKGKTTKGSDPTLWRFVSSCQIKDSTQPRYC